jgi:hypothetical protein
MQHLKGDISIGTSKVIMKISRCVEGFENAMPDKDVRTIQDLIYYQYAARYAREIGPQITNFWGLRCATRGGLRI